MIGVITHSNVAGSVLINAVVGDSVITKNGDTGIACDNGWTGGSVRMQIYVASVINQGAGKVRIGCKE